MKTSSRLIQLFTAVLLFLFTLATSSTTFSAAPSATFNVNASFDAIDANPGDGICAVAANLGSACTLRAAVEEANLNVGADTINLPSAVYLLTVAGGTEQTNFPNARVNDLDLTDVAGVTINGNGSTIIFAVTPNQFNLQTAVFEVASGASAVIDNLIIDNSVSGYRNNQGDLTITNGVIRNGRTSATGVTFDSSAILSTGDLTIDNLTVTNMPSAANAFGGTITTKGQGTTTTLSNVHITNSNDVGISVGGNNSTTTITNSSVDGSDESGLMITGGQVTIANSTFSNNALGGIELFGLVNNSVPNVDISNSTISGNLGRGGLHFFNGTGMTIQLNNVTITNNQGGSNGGTFAGGITIPAEAQLSARNSIIAGNTSPVSSADCSGTIQSQGHNLIGSTTGCTISGSTIGNIVNQSPALGTLTDNGGSTLTHKPLTGSPVLNAGNPAAPGGGGNACKAQDQIGANRPLGSACDIGAVEGASGAAVPPTLTTLSPTSTTAGGAGFTLTVNGSGFNASAIVRWKGQNRPTTFVSANQLQATISAADISIGQIAGVTVFDPVQGVSSNSVNFTVNNPVPTVTTSTPTNARFGSTAVVTINGTNFNPSSEVLMDGTPLVTTFVSSTQVKASVSSGTIGTIRTLRVRNPAPGGGTSATFVTLTSVVRTPPHVGIGSFADEIDAATLMGELTLNWVHPEDWRNLDTMEVRLVDEDGRVVLWLGFLEDFGTHGALVIRDAEGRIASIGFPGEETSLSSEIGTLEMADSLINAAPGTTIEAVYAVQFDAAVRGRTFAVEISANNNEANNSEGHGFEPVGNITIPSQIFLPLVKR